jgi:hypothetical protein
MRIVKNDNEQCIEPIGEPPLNLDIEDA